MNESINIIRGVGGRDIVHNNMLFLHTEIQKYFSKKDTTKKKGLHPCYIETPLVSGCNGYLKKKKLIKEINLAVNLDYQ
jgi:hypothetical protein